MHRSPSHDTVLDLISDVYSAAEEARLWPSFLERLGEAVGAPTMALHAEDLRSKRGCINISIELDPAYERSYREYYSGTNIWLARGFGLFQPGRIVTGEMVVSKSEFDRSEFLNDWLKPQDLYHDFGAVLLKQQSHVSFLSAARPQRLGPFDHHEVELMNVLMPHLQGALQLHRQLQAADQKLQTFVEALDRIHRAVFLIGAAGCVVHMNAPARALVAARDGLRLDGGELRTGRAEDDTTLRRLLVEAVKTSTRQGTGAGGGLQLGRPSGRRPLGIVVSPVPRTEVAAGIDGLALVIASDPESQLIPDEDAIRSVWGLTPAEAHLTRLVAEGSTLVEISERLGLRTSTLRTRLKAVFEKTNTHSQADLVRLTLSVGPLT